MNFVSNFRPGSRVTIPTGFMPGPVPCLNRDYPTFVKFFSAGFILIGLLWMHVPFRDIHSTHKHERMLSGRALVCGSACATIVLLTCAATSVPSSVLQPISEVEHLVFVTQSFYKNHSKAGVMAKW